MVKALVTGGAGFIGSNVVELLIQNGWDVNVLDNLSTGNKELLPQSVNLIVGDIRDKEAIRIAAKGSYPSVIPSFISRALNNEPLRIFGDGNQTRDFVFVQDVANANVKAAIANMSSVKTTTWNIGCGIPTPIIELANSINSICGQTTDSLTFEPPLQGDIYESCADIQLSEKQIPWKPTISLQDGLQLTYNGWKV